MPRWEFIIVLAIFLILGDYSLADIGNALTESGNKLLPNYQLLGILIVIFILLFIAFTQEFTRFFDSVESKIKEKQ